MLKIGEFSKLSRVSVRMLRHYDEIGLLKPAVTVASCTFKGGYDQMDSAMAAVAVWVNNNGYEPDDHCLTATTSAPTKPRTRRSSSSRDAALCAKSKASR